jgi:hypothetical protein
MAHLYVIALSSSVLTYIRHKVFPILNNPLTYSGSAYFSVSTFVPKHLIPIFAALTKGGEVDEWLKSTVC